MTQESIDLTPKIAERLRFFYSNANLRRDKFLRREILETNASGLVPISTLLKFNTIKNITTDVELITKAAKEDEFCKKHLKLNDEGTSIGRVKPFTQDMMEESVQAKFTLRVSNLPLKGEGGDAEYANTREEVRELFTEFGYVSLVNLIMAHARGSQKRYAIGRAFIEFDTEESLKKAAEEFCVEGDLADDDKKPKKVLKIGETELRVKTMKQWLNKRAAKYAARNGGKQNVQDGGIKKEDNIKQEDGIKQEEQGNGIKKEPIAGDKRAAPVDVPQFTLDWKKGCVISIKGVPEGCDREKIVDAVKGFMGDDIEVRADYSRGQKDGALRFNEPNEKISELSGKLNDGTITVADGKLESAAVLEGEAEEEYYKNYIDFRNKQQQMRAEGNQQRKKGRFHRGRGRGRR